MRIQCFNCKSNKIQELVEDNKVYYFCEDCKTKSGKAIIVDRHIKIINTSRGIKHISVAALIINDGKLLLGYRRTYPFGLEVPVGHVEYDESLEEALHREVYEEVGLQVTGHTLLAEIEHPVSYCRYGSAIEEWAVFLVECRAGESFVSNNEIETLLWIPLTELQDQELTPSTRFVLECLGYLETNLAKQQR